MELLSEKNTAVQPAQEEMKKQLPEQDRDTASAYGLPYRIVKKFFLSLLVFILSLLGVIILLEASPIYSFQKPEKFSGTQIYNPYADLDTALGWSRTNLHTHTHATKWINECEFYPDSVLSFYRQYGYDIVTFSNHMELTEYPGDSTRTVDVYEHGWNLFKFHKLVFGPERICYYDIPFPVMPSQKQFLFDILGRRSDFVFFNHPDRTFFTDGKDMERVTGYRLTEADCGFGYDDTWCRKWDAALSSGHYVPSAISDDLHKPRLSHKIARRCTFLNTPAPRYENIKECLLKGNFYSMHLPDFGDGDLDIKREKNGDLAGITDIGIRSDTIYMSLSRPAAEIEIIGQDGERRALLTDTGDAGYVMTDEDTYIRMTARFADSTVIFTNPFARWSGGTISGTPYVEAPHPIDIVRTILYNMLLLAAAFLCLKAVRSLKNLF